MTTETSLPCPEQVSEARTMFIVRVRVTDLPCRLVETTINRSVDGGRVPLVCRLYSIDDDRIRGYIPTKSLLVDKPNELFYEPADSGPALEMIFFTSASLPANVRPYGQGKTHVLTAIIDHNTVIDYDIDARILIDQQVHNNLVMYIFVFGDLQYDSVIAKIMPTKEEHA